MIIKGNILGLSTDKFRYKIVDNKLRKFPVFYNNDRTHILNYENISINDINNCTIRLDFYDESREDTIRIVKSYQ